MKDEVIIQYNNNSDLILRTQFQIINTYIKVKN